MAKASSSTTETTGKRGGARPNAGRKNAEVEAATSKAHIVLANARAKKELHLANLAEIEFKAKSGEYVSRELVRQAQAKVYAACAHSLRAIPDSLERKLGVSPDVAEAVGNMIDEALAALADEMEELHSGCNR